LPSAVSTGRLSLVGVPSYYMDKVYIWEYEDEVLCVSSFRNNSLLKDIMSKSKMARFGNKLGRAWTANIEKCQQSCGVMAHWKAEQDGKSGTWCVTL